MRKFGLGSAALSLAMLVMGSAAYAELNTVTYISHDGGGDGRVDGDLTGVGEVTLLDGPGGDFWNGGDQGIYLHDDDLVTGDFTATVRVVAQTEAVNGRWGKAGIRASGTLDGNSANAMAAVFAGNGSQIDPPETGDHSPIPVRITGRTGNDGQGGFELPVFDSAGAEITNNVFPPAPAGTQNPPINKSWLRLQYREEGNSFLVGYAEDNDGTPGTWGYSAPVTNVPATGDGWIVGLAYSAHNSLELDNVADADGFHGITFDNYSILDKYLLPQLQVAGTETGSLTVGGEVTDVVLGPEELGPGLKQFWYEGNMRAMPEEFLDAGDEGSAAFPLAAGGFRTDTTWWSGSQSLTVNGNPIPSYPTELASTSLNSPTDNNNYGVRLTGEIFIEENGEFLFRDGIDDYTMLAIDQDGNGELDELDTITAADLDASFGDVIIHDDDWANINGSDQPNNGFAEFENVDAGGEWRSFELWMAEGGGGDGGVLYMASVDDPDLWDEASEGAISQDQIDKFTIPNDKLRSATPSIQSGNSAATLGDFEYVMQVGADGGDQIAVDDEGGVLNTTLDLAGKSIRLEALEGITEGTEHQLFLAGTLTGTDTLSVVFDDDNWDLSRINEGIVVYGVGMGGCMPLNDLLGDLDGDGSVGFPDFLTLSANFGQDVSSYGEGDVTCDGTVGFPDFLALSANFGQSLAAGGAAAAVPEPSGLALLGLSAMLFGLVRRRR